MASWDCPYCGRLSIMDAMEKTKIGAVFQADTKHGDLYHGTYIFVCPNKECKEYTIVSYVTAAKMINGYLKETDEILARWKNKPQGIVKEFPDYIPKAILEDYREAALIRELSPKASATLARRCLQGMIRNFWEVKEKNLFLEIQAISDKVDPDTWKAIDAIRSIGNIGAHMEKDIDLIIEVQPSEAQLLIELIESLLKDWYVNREERKLRAAAIIGLADSKKSQKQ